MSNFEMKALGFMNGAPHASVIPGEGVCEDPRREG